MSEKPTTSVLEDLLATTYSNILHHAKEDSLPMAEKNFYSTRDYALGDTVSCSADTALENCEQIKSCFPPGTPEEVFKNIDKVEAEIRRLEGKNRPRLFRRWGTWILIAAIMFFIYFLLTHKN